MLFETSNAQLRRELRYRLLTAGGKCHCAYSVRGDRYTDLALGGFFLPDHPPGPEAPKLLFTLAPVASGPRSCFGEPDADL